VYVQPQWVWDSVNDGRLRSADLYAPGAQLPPHLSPFVASVHGQYDPTMPLEDQQPIEEALESEDDGERDEYAVKAIESGQQVENSEASDDDSSDFKGFSEDEAFTSEEEKGEGEEEEEDPARQRQRELEAELEGRAVKVTTSKPVSAREEARRELARRAREEAEDVERAKGMLSKKKRRLYEQMVYSNSKRSEEDRQLRAKRRRIEKENGVTRVS
jgi:pescadillo protein